VTPKLDLFLLLKEKVEQALQKLERQGITSSIKYSDWAVPIVSVLKQSGDIIICGDYRVTVNQAIKNWFISTSTNRRTICSFIRWEIF